MFESPPFVGCPKCQSSLALGVLHIGSTQLVQRCRYCKFTTETVLPLLNKKVIYLDQFAVSNIYKIRSGESLNPRSVHVFWSEFYRRINRALVSQSAIFPASDIHFNETLLSRFSVELKSMHALFGGGTSLIDTDTLVRQQEIIFLDHFLRGQGAPTVRFDVDSAMRGRRNSWIPHIQISANFDYSGFVNEVRSNRQRMHEAMLPLFKYWQAEKPKFKEVLQREIVSYSKARVESAVSIWNEYACASDARDIDKIIDISMSKGMRDMMIIFHALESRGIPEKERFEQFFAFLRWPELQKLPYHYISAHIFAVTSTRLAAGQKKLPTRGFVNDVRAIATYAPYVDAMFIDNECENLINDGQIKSKLCLNTKIYSKKSANKFFDYLEKIEIEQSHEVKKQSDFLYNIAKNNPAS